MDIDEILHNFDKIRNEHLRLTDTRISVLKKLITGQILDEKNKALLRKLVAEGWNFNISGVDHKSNVKDFYANSCLLEHLQTESQNLWEDIVRLKSVTKLETFPEVIEEFLRQFIDNFDAEMKKIFPNDEEVNIQQLIGISQDIEKSIDVRFRCPGVKGCKKRGYHDLCDRQKLWNHIVYKIINLYLYPRRGLQIGGDTSTLKYRIKEKGICGIRINYSK